MRSPDIRPPSFPTCIRCGIYMVRRSVESVAGTDQAPVHVQVYQCPSCDKFAAEEIDPATEHGPDEAA